MIDGLRTKRPQVLEAFHFFNADRAYDDTRFLVRFIDDHGIRPIIDITDHWKSEEETRLFKSRDNTVYDYRNRVNCCCPKELKLREMAYAGLKKKGRIYCAVWFSLCKKR